MTQGLVLSSYKCSDVFIGRRLSIVSVTGTRPLLVVRAFLRPIVPCSPPLLGYIVSVGWSLCPQSYSSLPVLSNGIDKLYTSFSIRSPVRATE